MGSISVNGINTCSCVYMCACICVYWCVRVHVCEVNYTIVYCKVDNLSLTLATNPLNVVKPII